jgi:hypothetical protein
MRAWTLPPYDDEGYEKIECLVMIKTVLIAHDCRLGRWLINGHEAWETLLDFNAVVQRMEVIGIRYDEMDFSFQPDGKHNVIARSYISGRNYEYGPSIYHDVGSDDQIIEAVRYLDTLDRLAAEE